MTHLGRLVRLAAAAAVISGASAAFGQLMVPDGFGKRIMLFSAVDGSLIDADWIAEANAVGWTFPSQPAAVEMVGNEIWLSGRWNTDGFEGILRLDHQGNFRGRIPTFEGDPHGMGTDGANVLVTMNGTAGIDLIATYTLDGNQTGLFEAAGGPHDAAHYQGGIIAGNLGALGLFDQFGAYLGDFATGIGSIEQIAVLPDDSVITVNSLDFFNPQLLGAYHFNADGTLRAFIPTGGPFFGPRGAVLLENGNYFLAGSGVHVAAADGAGGFTITEVLSGVNAWQIGVFSPPVDDDLRINITDSAAVVSPAEPLTYTVFVRNAGETALTNVNVATTLSGLMQYTSSSLGAHDMSAVGGVHTASFASIAPLGAESYTISVSAQTLGAATTTSVGSADQADPDPSNNTASAETTVNHRADLVVTIEDSPDPVPVFDGVLSYFVQVVNFGPGEAGNVTVVLELDPETTFSSTSAGTHDGSASGGVLTANLGTVPSGQSTSFTVDVVAGDTNGATYTATVNASSDATDTSLVDNTASATTLLAVPPGNDDCANATPLALSIPQPGTTLGATGSTSVECGSHPSDVWYEFVPDPNESYRFTVSFSSTIGTLGAFDDCFGTEVACGFGRDISMDVTADAAGTPILLRAATRPTLPDDFEIAVGRIGCVCETDGDAGQVDVFDLLAYLDLWFVNDAAADIDDADGVDVFDLLFFLDCWFPASAGTPC